MEPEGLRVVKGEDGMLRAYPRGCLAVWQRCREWEQVLEGNYVASKTFTSDTRCLSFSEGLRTRGNTPYNYFFFLIKVIVQRLQIPTSLCGPWRDRGRDKFPTVRHVLGFLPTVQAPAARGGIHSWKGITRLKSQDPALPFKCLRS